MMVTKANNLNGCADDGYKGQITNGCADTSHMAIDGYRSHGDGGLPGRMVIEGNAWSRGDRGLNPVTR